MMTAEASVSAVKLPAGVIEAHAAAHAATCAITAHMAAVGIGEWEGRAASWSDEYDRLEKIERAALAELMGALGYHIGAQP